MDGVYALGEVWEVYEQKEWDIQKYRTYTIVFKKYKSISEIQKYFKDMKIS